MDVPGTAFEQMMIVCGWVKVPGQMVNPGTLKEPALRQKALLIAVRRALYIVGDAIGEYLGLAPRVKVE